MFIFMNWNHFAVCVLLLQLLVAKLYNQERMQHFCLTFCQKRAIAHFCCLLDSTLTFIFIALPNHDCHPVCVCIYILLFLLLFKLFCSEIISLLCLASLSISREKSFFSQFIKTHSHVAWLHQSLWEPKSTSWMRYMPTVISFHNL